MNCGPSWPDTKLDMGRKPDLRVLPGLGGAARKELGFEGDRSSSRALAVSHRCPRAAGLSCWA